MPKGLLHWMIEALYEDTFNGALAMDEDLLKDVPCCSGNTETDLDVFVIHRETYVIMQTEWSTLGPNGVYLGYSGQAH